MKNRKIQEQLLIWFLIFTVIPLSVISFWCYLLASRIINQKSSSYAAESIQQLSDNLDQLLVQIENTSLSISYNNYIQNALEKSVKRPVYQPGGQLSAGKKYDPLHMTMHPCGILPSAPLLHLKTIIPFFVYLPGWIRIQRIYFTQLLT